MFHNVIFSPICELQHLSVSEHKWLRVFFFSSQSNVLEGEIGRPLPSES